MRSMVRWAVAGLVTALFAVTTAHANAPRELTWEDLLPPHVTELQGKVEVINEELRTTPKALRTKLREVLEWVPQVSLERGLELTYRWIEGQLRAQGRIPG